MHLGNNVNLKRIYVYAYHVLHTVQDINKGNEFVAASAYIHSPMSAYYGEKNFSVMLTCAGLCGVLLPIGLNVCKA